jgi:capsular polysaccharide biosynthesis protein
MRRYLGTFFRHAKLLVAVMVLLVGASVVGAFQLSHAQYEVTARIWVDKPVLNSVVDPTGQAYTPVSPAQEQSDKLYQLLQTDSFMAAILRKSDAGRTLRGVPDEDKDTIARYRKPLAVSVIGANTIAVSFRGEDPRTAQQIVQGVLDEFLGWNLQSQIENASVALDFYQKQIEIYDQRVRDAQNALDQFRERNPSPSVASPQYLELQRLQRELESARGLSAAANTKLAEVSLVDKLSTKDGRTDFEILDKPTVPQRPTGVFAAMAKYLGIGLAASIGLVLAVVFFLTWQDTTIRAPVDLEELSAAPVLALLPRLPASRASSALASIPEDRTVELIRERWVSGTWNVVGEAAGSAGPEWLRGQSERLSQSERDALHALRLRSNDGPVVRPRSKNGKDAVSGSVTRARPKNGAAPGTGNGAKGLPGSAN